MSSTPESEHDLDRELSGAGFRVLAHTADAGLELWADSLADVFAVATRGLFHLIGEPTTLSTSAPRTITASGVDIEDALVRLLTVLLGEFDIDGFFVTAAACERVEHGERRVRVEVVCEGGTVDRNRERDLVEIKAVTYHGLVVEQQKEKWVARVFVDL